jgi:hypothetical protein
MTDTFAVRFPDKDSPHAYIRKLTRMLEAGVLPASGLAETTIKHDNWCKIFSGGYCNCDPVIRVHRGRI